MTSSTVERCPQAVRVTNYDDTLVLYQYGNGFIKLRADDTENCCEVVITMEALEQAIELLKSIPVEP